LLCIIQDEGISKGTKTNGFTAKVGTAVFTPLMTYITVETELKPGALEAFIAEHGESGHGQRDTCSE